MLFLGLRDQCIFGVGMGINFQCNLWEVNSATNSGIYDFD